MPDIRVSELPGVLILTPPVHAEARGDFCEVWNRDALAEAGLCPDFCQDNQSRSTHAGTLRGLHYQAPPFAQGKLVRCVAGALFDVAVDVRPGSATFGRWVGVRPSAANNRQLWIPPGFLHGFVTRAENTVCLYKCTRPYDAASEGSVAWNDPDLAIDWGLEGSAPVISDRDAAAPTLGTWRNPF